MNLMKKIKLYSLRPTHPFLILISIPLLLAWVNVDLQELLADKKARQIQTQEEEKRIAGELSRLQLKPLRIIQKMESAMQEANGFKSKIEIWQEYPSYQANIRLDQEFEDQDKVYITGRTSFSSLIPSAKASSFEWIRSFQLGGQSYVFNRIKGEWEREKLRLSQEQEMAAVEYGLFQSLASPQTDFITEETVRIVSLKKFKGRECFILQFSLNPSFFKQQNLAGKVDNYTLWVDKEKFYPYMLRIEGSVGQMRFLEIVEYFDFDIPISLKFPPEVNNWYEGWKQELLQKTEELAQRIKDLRGGSFPEGMKRSFLERRKLRKQIREGIEEEYRPEELSALGYLCKWMNFLPADYDYKEWIINSRASSVSCLYAPREKTFYLAERISSNLAEAVIAQELMRAFQDQALGLENFIKEAKYLDQRYARKFLLEGEAAAVMLQLVFDKQENKPEDREDILELIKEKLSGEEDNASEKGYSRLIYSGYAYGARFIQEAIKVLGWQELNKLYREPPSAMRQILHPELYFPKKENPKKIDWSILSSLSVWNGWQKFYQDSLGEFTISFWLEIFLDTEEARRASEGLVSDEIIIYRRVDQKEPLIVFLSGWATSGDAQEFQDAYQRLQDKKWDDKAKKEVGKNYILWHADGRDDCIGVNQNLAFVVSANKLDKQEIDALLKVLEDVLKSSEQPCKSGDCLAKGIRL
jgi:hypothetical protein